MTYTLSFDSPNLGEHNIQVTGSKSESNRLLILQGLYSQLEIYNLSESDDSKVMRKALAVSQSVIDVHHAGTAMRFLTSYLAIQEGKEFILTGSQRMQQRPIGVLVEALRNLGASIAYEAKEGYPPLRIQGKKLKKHRVTIPANVSSQYISSLLLVAPSLENGLELTLEGEITSRPYIAMTLSLLHQIGVATSFKGQVIKVEPLKEVVAKGVTVESDWSSASYFYSVLALADKGSIQLASYKQDSLQGDSALVTIYSQLGIHTKFEASQSKITLTKVPVQLPELLELDLITTPDLAQTIALTCFGLGIACRLTGLHTLKIKETDRLLALQTELKKLGASCHVTESSLELQPSTNIQSDVVIDTYQDHRMAMAFAPLALKVPIKINDPMVVTKSFPSFWKDWQTLGAHVQEQDNR